jgi:bifunctional enzyme CysN/CysC
MGAFILVDRMTNATVVCGVIDFALRRAANIARQALGIYKRARAGLKAQKPCVLWLTGLSGAGKSTIADLVEQSLHRAVPTPWCSTATTSATASAAISAFPTRTGSRTSAALPRWRS